MPDEAVIAARDIGKAFSGIQALQDVSLEARRGEIVGLIGANGSGKSTFLKILAGRLQPDYGEARVLGEVSFPATPFLHSHTSYIPQDAAVDPEMTGWENLSFFRALYGLPADLAGPRLAELGRDFGLDSHLHRRVGNYSGGMRQRLHLALGFIHRPSVLLLDEPTAALDPEGRRMLWERLSDCAKRGEGAVVVSTHELVEVTTHCDKVVILAQGRQIAFDAPGKLIMKHGATNMTLTLKDTHVVASVLRPRLEEIPGIGRIQEFDRRYRISWMGGDNLESSILQVVGECGLDLISYEIRRPDLESAYYNLTGEELQRKSVGNVRPPS